MLIEYILIAFKSLVTHKARAFLTMLGVVIGVFAVIMLVSLGTSVKDEAAAQIRGLGSNLVLVNLVDKNGYLPKVWLDDLKNKAAINEYSQVVQGNVSYNINGEEFNARIYGVNEHYSYISSLKTEEGRFFNGIDTENNTAVAVIGLKVKSALFNEESAIGKAIAIKGIPFKVIGVLEKQGTSFSGDMDKAVYIPGGFASSLFPMQNQKTYYVASESEALTDYTRNAIEKFLKRSLPSNKMYMVFSQTQMLDMLNQIMGLLTALLGGIAAISLLVGGIGIMNIMLVTVRERTREIGVRKALGARRSNILMQFLTEAVIITVTGGLMGLVFSIIGARIVTAFAGFEVKVGIGAIIIAIVFSTVIGIVFGIYPADKASKLEPVEALRYE